MTSIYKGATAFLTATFTHPVSGSALNLSGTTNTGKVVVPVKNETTGEKVSTEFSMTLDGTNSDLPNGVLVMTVAATDTAQFMVDRQAKAQMKVVDGTDTYLSDVAVLDVLNPVA